MTVKAEIVFMVTRSNGAGIWEKRTMEISEADFRDLNSSNRNEKCKGWMLMQFPGAKDVKIQTIMRVFK